MKKSLFIIISALLVFIATLYILDHQRMKEGREVLISTWGKKYTPIVNPLEVHYFEAFEYGHPEEIEFDKTKSIVLQSTNDQQNFNNHWEEENPLTKHLAYNEEFYKNHTVIITMFWANAIVSSEEYSLTKFDLKENNLSMEITYTPTPDTMYPQVMCPFYQVVVILKEEIKPNDITVTIK